MHPVMTHYNGLNIKTDDQISFMTHKTPVAMLLPTIVLTGKWESHLSKVSGARFSERRLTPEINLEGNNGRTERCKHMWKNIPRTRLQLIHR